MLTHLPVLHSIERAVLLTTHHNQEMGHDPRLMAAVVRSHLIKDYGYSALESVNAELSKMSEESFHEAVLGSASKVPMTHLASNVLLTMQEAVTRQISKPPIAVGHS